MRSSRIRSHILPLWWSWRRCVFCWSRRPIGMRLRKSWVTLDSSAGCKITPSKPWTIKKHYWRSSELSQRSLNSTLSKSVRRVLHVVPWPFGSGPWTISPRFPNKSNPEKGKWQNWPQNWTSRTGNWKSSKMSWTLSSQKSPNFRRSAIRL